MAKVKIHEPDFLICLECESPCYTFEWDYELERPSEAFCQACGNDKRQEFATEKSFWGEEEG